MSYGQTVRKAAELEVVYRKYGETAFVFLLFTCNSSRFFHFFLENTFKNHQGRWKTRGGASSRAPECSDPILILCLLYCLVSDPPHTGSRPGALQQVLLLSYPSLPGTHHSQEHPQLLTDNF